MSRDTGRKEVLCQEEMEQDQRERDQGQEEPQDIAPVMPRRDMVIRAWENLQWAR